MPQHGPQAPPRRQRTTHERPRALDHPSRDPTTHPNAQSRTVQDQNGGFRLNGLDSSGAEVVSYLFETSRDEIKRKFRCDPYLLPVCSVGHSAYWRYEHTRLWTEKYWAAYKNRSGTVPDGVGKGYVEVVGP